MIKWKAILVTTNQIFQKHDQTFHILLRKIIQSLGNLDMVLLKI